MHSSFKNLLVLSLKYFQVEIKIARCSSYINILVEGIRDQTLFKLHLFNGQTICRMLIALGHIQKPKKQPCICMPRYTKLWLGWLSALFNGLG